MKLNLRDSPDLSELFSVYTFKTFQRISGESSLDIEHPWEQVINVQSNDSLIGNMAHIVYEYIYESDLF